MQQCPAPWGGRRHMYLFNLTSATHLDAAIFQIRLTKGKKCHCPPSARPLRIHFLIVGCNQSNPLIILTFHILYELFLFQLLSLKYFFFKMPFRQMAQFEPCCSSYNYSFTMFGPRVIEAVHSNGPLKTDRKQTRRGGANVDINWTIDCHQSFGKNYSKILLMITTIALISINGGAMAQSTGKCYSFSPGLTIPGADYRRDFGLSRKECAEVCKSDLCCMAFEWRRNGGQCTLKSKSLNGTVTAASKLEHKDEGQKQQRNTEEQDKDENSSSSGGGGGDTTFFALCLDYGDSDRDRFWDHELFGPVVAAAAAIERSKCAELCGDFTLTVAGGKRFRRAGKAQAERRKGPAVIYSWRSHNPTDVETPLGECQCISVLQHIRVSFGSFAGFLI